MIGIIYSNKDSTSVNIADRLIEKHGEKGDNFKLCRIESELVNYSKADMLGFEFIYFLSKHQSAEGVPSITTHATGNWNSQNKLGGEPRKLSVAAPLQMLAFLRCVNEVKPDVELTYEATHHGPLLNTPSLFVEVGGDMQTRENKELAGVVAEAAFRSISESLQIYDEKIAIGIGSNHYPEKFTKLALEKNYAFSHIMPKYAMFNDDKSNNIDMLAQAFSRSEENPDIAVIEWKGINAGTRELVIQELSKLGLDYERI